MVVLGQTNGATGLVGNTLSGTGPNGDRWTAYYGPGGALYTWNHSTGEGFIERYSVDADRLCYTDIERCWSVTITGNRVEIAAGDALGHGSWVLQPGDPIGLVARAARECWHTHGQEQCL